MQKVGTNMSSWNPWHGCQKLSAGCAHCYVYRIDASHEKDASQVYKTNAFDMPIRKNRSGEYKIPPGDTVWTCFSSDFLLDSADGWREEAWRMIRERTDLHFIFITKRIDRFADNCPSDWGDGYDNVTIGCTCENQDRADYRLPIFLSLPIKHRFITCEPLLEHIDLSPYLGTPQLRPCLADIAAVHPCIEQVVVGGESGPQARVCDYSWVLDIRDQCVTAGVSFHFKQTGASFVKDGRHYHVDRNIQHEQAAKAGIDYNEI
jgi:protein gp37